MKEICIRELTTRLLEEEEIMNSKYPLLAEREREF
jgi:hypothetical protein